MAYVSLLDPDLTFRAASATAATSVPSDGAGAPLMLVLPGGGYQMHADHEGTDVADWLAGIGIHALVIRYPVAPERFPAGLRRVQEVLAAARSGELALGAEVTVDRGRIGVAGFSAGGHVAALLSTGTALAPAAAPGAASDPASGPAPGGLAGPGRVDLTVLAYPVISMIHEPHSGSLTNLLGGADTLDARRALSAELLVDAHTPPAFIWHTADDGGVPVSHSLRYAEALAAHNVPFDLHVFERGEHGKGLASGLGPLEAWTALCAAWLQQRGWGTPQASSREY